MKMFGTAERKWLHSTAKTLDVILSFTLKWLILCYMNFTISEAHKKFSVIISPLLSGSCHIWGLQTGVPVPAV
jgi:hypothetical protein